MKSLKINFQLFVVVFLIYSSSCKKIESNTSTVTELGSQEKFTIFDYNNLRKLEWKGLFSIADSKIVTQSYVNGKDWHRGSTFVGAQAFKDVSQIPPATANGITLKIPDIRDGKSPNQLEMYENDERGVNLFGQNVNISAFGINGSIYVPEKLKLLAPIPDNISINSFKGTPIKRAEGVSLKWNSDAKNKRGVILEIDFYYPDGRLGPRTVRVLDDNGSYTVTPDLLSEIPKDAYFELILVRGNYHISENKEDLIMCVANVSSGYKLID
jgi:hypothetical protein